MRRSLERYAATSPQEVARGSYAQMAYFAEDAKADIATLADENTKLRQALKGERERCAEKAASLGRDLRNADHFRHAAAKIASLIRQDPSEEFESWTDHDRYMD